MNQELRVSEAVDSVFKMPSPDCRRQGQASPDKGIFSAALKHVNCFSQLFLSCFSQQFLSIILAWPSYDQVHRRKSDTVSEARRMSKTNEPIMQNHGIWVCEWTFIDIHRGVMWGHLLCTMAKSGWEMRGSWLFEKLSMTIRNSNATTAVQVLYYVGHNAI